MALDNSYSGEIVPAQVETLGRALDLRVRATCQLSNSTARKTSLKSNEVNGGLPTQSGAIFWKLPKSGLYWKQARDG